MSMVCLTTPSEPTLKIRHSYIDKLLPINKTTKFMTSCITDLLSGQSNGSIMLEHPTNWCLCVILFITNFIGL